MTKSNVVFMLAMLLAAACNGASIDLTKWQFAADVNIGNTTSEYHALTVTPEIYNVAGTDLADIRLIDNTGSQIPYLLVRDEDRTETVKYNPTILNRSADAAGNALVTLDFGGQTIKNSIEVDTSGDNFRRAVKIEGSNDNVQFFTIIDRSYIFAVSDKNRHRFSGIDLPSNDYRYLRITVSPMSAEDSRLTINEVRAFKIEKLPALKRPLAMLQTEHSEDANTHSSVYVYDLKRLHLPVVEIELRTNDESFYRCVRIQGRDAATQKVKIDSEDNRQRFTEVEVPWNTVATDTIYRYTAPDGRKRERLALPIGSGPSYRYLKVIISNYDDQPITVALASAKIVPHEIIFSASTDKSAKLYAGCASAVRPNYDLSRRVPNGANVKAEPAMIAALIDNPLFAKTLQKLPWTEQHKTLLLVVLVAVVAVMGVFMLKSVKHIQKQETPP
jgi:hypothetical protein